MLFTNSVYILVGCWHGLKLEPKFRFTPCLGMVRLGSLKNVFAIKNEMIFRNDIL